MRPREETLRRALDYPYATPPESYVQVGEQTLPLAAVDVDLSSRVPLLAYGSNASPEVLRRKLGPDTDPVPAIRASLSDFDVVYSAHVSIYGAVPATLWHCPGAEAPVFVVHFTEAQLRTVAATEPNYEEQRLRGVACALETGDELTDLSAYLSRHGPLLREGSPVALSEVATRGRTLASMPQEEAIESVRRRVAPELELERFVLESARDPELPGRWTVALRSDGGEAAEGEAGE